MDRRRRRRRSISTRPIAGPSAPTPCSRAVEAISHADAYAGFAGLYEADTLTGAPAPLTEVACWAHARRKIYKVHVETNRRRGAGARNDRAAVCDRGRHDGRPPSERLAARRAKATPILSELRACLDATMQKVSGKSSLASAFRSAASRWTALTRDVGDGRLEMSNNAAGRAMRPWRSEERIIRSPARMKAAAAPPSSTHSSKPRA